jgi:hypothetical protein
MGLQRLFPFLDIIDETLVNFIKQKHREKGGKVQRERTPSLSQKPKPRGGHKRPKEQIMFKNAQSLTPHHYFV